MTHQLKLDIDDLERFNSIPAPHFTVGFYESKIEIILIDKYISFYTPSSPSPTLLFI